MNRQDRQGRQALFRPLWLIFLLAVAGAGARAEAASVLNFPRLSFETNTLTGVAFVNPTGIAAEVTVTAFGTGGDLLSGNGFQNPVTVKVPAGRQLARLLVEIFGAALPPETVGWFQATSPVDGITGFFLFLNTSITRFDGADLPELGHKIIFNEIRAGGGAWTEFNLFNPGGGTANLQLRLHRPGSAPEDSLLGPVLAPRGVLRFLIGDFFEDDSQPLDQVPDGSYLEVISDVPIGGFELARAATGDLLGLNARLSEDRLGQLFFPQLAVLGPWQTRLNLINYSNQAVILAVFAYQPDGTLHTEVLNGNPVNLALEAGGSAEVDVAALFGFSGGDTRDGWIKVESSSAAINGFISYGVPATGSLAAVAAQTQVRTRAIFSHIATSLGYFTGVAALNSGALSTNIRVMAFRINGELLGTYNGILRPGERISKLIHELIPAANGQGGGFVWIKSDLPIYLTSLFGTFEGSQTVLSNIPPQPAPAGYNPDSGLPTLQLVPPLAIVQPSKSQQFTPQGAIDPVTWKVNGMTGGDGMLGTISPGGLYQAPASSPSPLPVSISATSGSLAAGASVDVLSKDVLLGGLGIVQAVAYLDSLGRLYSAELTALGALGEGTTPAADEPDSLIFALLPAKSQIADFPDETVSKMIPFSAIDGREYLLLSAKTVGGGRIIRLDPQTGADLTVISGLSSPGALVFNPTNGTLLVVDGQEVESYPRHILESDLIGALRAPGTDDRWSGISRIVADLDDPSGIAANPCNGFLYIAQGKPGNVIEVNPFSGERRVVASRLGNPGPLLGLMRRDVPCPDSFQLLVQSRETGALLLLTPSRNLVTVWLQSEGGRDLAFLGSGNPFLDLDSILIAELPPAAPGAAASGRISFVPVPDLYEDPPLNAPPVPSFLGGADPLGDTLGFGKVQHDILEVDIMLAGEEALITVTFAQPVSPPDSGRADAVGGYFDFDTDQNPATGLISFADEFSPFSSGIGSDLQLVLFDYDSGAGSAPLVQLPDQREVGAARIDFQGRVVFIHIPIQLLGKLPFFDLALIVGVAEEATDVAPNGGYFTTGGP